MNHRLFSFPIFRVLTLSLLFLPFASRAADPATPPAPATPASAGSQPVPADAPPAPTVPTETPEANPPAAPAMSSGERPATYTVVSGDTLWVIAHKFNTSIKKLKKLNHLKKDLLQPGQVLKIPAARSSPAKKTTSLSHHAKSVALHTTRRAEPVQDFDLPASTFASCPVPIPAESDAAAPSLSNPLANAQPSYPVPSGPLPPETDEATVTLPNLPSIPSSRHSTKNSVASARPTSSPPAVASAPPSSKPDHGLFNFFYTPPPSVDWGARFTQVARDLGDRDLEYDEDWCPPGETHSWSMDCSNTTRYLYRVTTGIQLPRTASDQYYYLHLQNKAWDVPQLADGFADCNYLRENLKPGDLLFWENTYKPDRQPPITHVMIFLGTNDRGQWIMAGSQSTRGGEHNRRHGGPDIYVFNPTRPCGGYSTWLGLVHHQGRFCAYGRPLEADKSKLAVAADD